MESSNATTDDDDDDDDDDDTGGRCRWKNGNAADESLPDMILVRRRRCVGFKID